MRKLPPILLLMLGVAAGGGAGWFLQPAHGPQTVAAHADDPHTGGGQPAEGHSGGAPSAEESVADGVTVRMPNQFVVPVISEGRVNAMVVIGLALVLRPENDFSLSTDEARIRAVFLQMLFDHANLGGFDGVFTSGEALLSLRRMLREAARAEIGPDLLDILITELMRQDN